MASRIMGHLYKRGKTNWIKYYRNGRAFYESSGSRKEGDAKLPLYLREGGIAKGVPVTPKVGGLRFGELAEDVTNDYRANSKPSIKDVELRFGPFDRWPKRNSDLYTTSS